MKQLSPYQNELQGLVVESTYNWYWLVDGLMDADAHWLAHMLRLGILKEGYVYPKEERAVRDLLRKRSQMVRQRTTQILSIQNLITRNTGLQLNGNKIKKLDN